MIKPIQQFIEEAKHLAELAKAKDDTYFSIMDEYDHLEQTWEIPAPQLAEHKQQLNLAVEHIITLEQNLSYFDPYFTGCVDKKSAIARDCRVWLITNQADEMECYIGYLEKDLASCDYSNGYQFYYGEKNHDDKKTDAYLGVLKQQLLTVRNNLDDCEDCGRSNAEVITVLFEAERATSCINQTLEFYYGTDNRPYSNIHFGLIQIENLLTSTKEEYRYFEVRTHERHHSAKINDIRQLIDDTLKQF